MPFDVETTMPPDSVTTPEIRLSIRSINLMCYLTGDVTYQQLYGQLFGFALDEIVKRARQLVDMPSGTKLKEGAYRNNDISRQLYDGLLAIQNGNPGFRSIVLKNLFLNKYTSGTEYDLVRRLYNIFTSSVSTDHLECELAHFCCPFLYFQLPGSTSITEPQFTDFLRILGGRAMYDLFTMRRQTLDRDEITMIATARGLNILLDSTPRPRFTNLALHPFELDSLGDQELLNINFGNGLYCDTGTCKPRNANDFCNDANGSCSGSSQP